MRVEKVNLENPGNNRVLQYVASAKNRQRCPTDFFYTVSADELLHLLTLLMKVWSREVDPETKKHVGEMADDCYWATVARLEGRAPPFKGGQYVRPLTNTAHSSSEPQIEVVGVHQVRNVTYHAKGRWALTLEDCLTEDGLYRHVFWAKHFKHVRKPRDGNVKK